MNKVAMLNTMATMQDAHNQQVHPDWRNSGFAYYRAVWVECAEMLDHFGWKWWKRQQPDLQQVKLELVDIWHFGMSDLMRSGALSNEVVGVLDVDITTNRVTTGALSGLPVDRSNQQGLAKRTHTERECSCARHAGDLQDKRARPPAGKSTPPRQQGSLGDDESQPVRPNTENSLDAHAENVRMAIEDLACATLVEKAFALPRFARVMALLPLSYDELFRLYVGKNVLNRFRQDHGYKAGTYVKVWAGREDNEHLVELLNGLDDPATAVTDLYGRLKGRYASARSS